jgi:hypothetical protein
MDTYAAFPPHSNRTLSELNRRVGVLERRVDPSKANPPARSRSAFVTVAAVDTPPELAAQATFRCDGTADDVEIAAAAVIAASVILLPGTYTLGTTVSPIGVLRGEGLVTLVAPVGSVGVSVGSGAVLDGVQVTASGHTAIDVDDGAVLRNVTVAGNVNNTGFNVHGDRATLVNCYAQVSSGTSFNIGGSNNLVVGARLSPSAAGVGSLSIGGDANMVTAAIALPSTDDLAVSIGGSSNLVLFTVEAPLSTAAQAVSVGGADNVVIYRAVGTFVADADTGSGNRINAFATGGGGGADWSVVDAKGDLIAGTGPDTVDNQPAGANVTFLKANSATATGLEWAALVDADIPAAIARDAEVTTAIAGHVTSDHAGLATDAELAAHEGAADPHPGYLTPTEGDAAYATVGHTHAGGAGAELVPYYLGTGETFTVPEFRQALFVEPIELDGGTLDVEGLLIEVDQPPDVSALVMMGGA